MRTLHVAECPSWGGGAAQVLALMSGLARRGDEVALGTTPGSELARRAFEAGFQVIPLELRSELNPAAIGRLAAHVLARRVDIVHAHASHAHSVGLLTSVVTGRPFVVTRRVSFRPKNNRGSNLKYRSGRVARVIAVSKAVADVLIDYGLDPSRIRVIYSGTDPAVFHAGVDGSGVRAELGLSTDVRVVGKVANFYHRWKGHDTFLEAASILSEGRPDVRFLLVGHETDAPKTAALVERYGLGERVVTAGFRRDIPEVIAALTVSVNAARSGEGLSGAVRESMVVGRPVVATDVGGNREVVTDGKTGLLVPPDNPRAMADALASLLDDPNLAARLAAGGAAFARENLTVDRMVRSTAEVYESILSG